MALSDKVNLQVKREGTIGNNTEMRYTFRLTSYNSTPISLADYRIVGFLNSYSPRTIAVQEGFGKGMGVGDFSGTLSDNNPQLISYTSAAGMPPRIYPPFEKYTYQWIYHFSGDATLNSAGAYWNDIRILLRNDDYRSFYHFASDGTIESGEHSLSRSYTYTSASSYHDNPSFILEYNDGGIWKKVDEVLNVGGTPDTNSGKYPYETVWLSAGGNTGDNRLAGFNTSYNHQIQIGNKDAYIFEGAISTNYGAVQSVGINGGGSGQATRAMYDFPWSSFTDDANYAELHLFCSNNNLGEQFEVNTLSGAWTEAGSNWSNSNELFSASTSGFHYRFNFAVPGVYDTQSSILPANLSIELLNKWRTGELTPYGVTFSYPLSSEHLEYNYGNPTLYFRESPDYFNKPKVIIVTDATTIGGFVWIGNTNSDWTVDSNWSGGVKPGPYDIALFDANYSTNPCDLGGNENVYGLSATAGYSGSLNLSAYSLSATSFAYFNNFTNMNPGTSTVTMLNSSILRLGNNSLYNLKVLSNDSLLIDSTTNGKVENTLDIENNASVNLAGDLIVSNGLNLTGTISGAGDLEFDGPVAINFTGSPTLCANTILSKTSKTLNAGTYYAPVTVVTSSSDWIGGNELDFSTGTFNFENGVNFVKPVTGSSQLIVDMENNPYVTVRGDLTLSGVDVTYWKFGTNDVNIHDDIFVNHIVTTATPWSSKGGGIAMVSNDDQQFKAHSVTYVPKIVHTGSGELKIDSTGFVVSAFTNAGGPINFNNQNFTSIGNFNVYNGDSDTFRNINSITFAVSGNTTLVGGRNGELLNLDNIIGHYWDVNGFLNATSASIRNSNASLGTSGTASNSLDGGSNVSWFFAGDTAPVITLGTAVPSSAASQNILIPVTVFDSNGLDGTSLGVDANSLYGISGVPTIHSATCATMEVVVSADGSSSPVISAVDVGGRVATVTAGPYFRDATPPKVTFGAPIPENPTSGTMLIPVSVEDAISVNSSDYKFATHDGNIGYISNILQVNPKKVTFTVTLTAEAYDAPLLISANDATGNMAISASTTLYTIDKSLPTVSGVSTYPDNKIAPSISATFNSTDNYRITGDSVSLKASIDNKYPCVITNIQQNSVSDVTYDVIVENTGTLYISAYDVAGNEYIYSDSGYVASPPFRFGPPVPSRESSDVITVNVSAYNVFTDDIDNYYARIGDQRMTISNLTSSSILSATYSFDVTISGTPDAIGDLIVSGGYIS